MVLYAQERRVSAPDLPPPVCYKPISELLKAAKDGQTFRPVTAEQIQQIIAGIPVPSLATANSARSEVSAESVGPKSPPKADASGTVLVTAPSAGGPASAIPRTAEPLRMPQAGNSTTPASIEGVGVGPAVRGSPAAAAAASPLHTAASPTTQRSDVQEAHALDGTELVHSSAATPGSKPRSAQTSTKPQPEGGATADAERATDVAGTPATPAASVSASTPVPAVPMETTAMQAAYGPDKPASGDHSETAHGAASPPASSPQHAIVTASAQPAIGPAAPSGPEPGVIQTTQQQQQPSSSFASRSTTASDSTNSVLLGTASGRQDDQADYPVQHLASPEEAVDLPAEAAATLAPVQTEAQSTPAHPLMQSVLKRNPEVSSC